ADRQRPLGEERPEAFAAAAERAERRIVRVGESARGGTEWKRREQRHDLLVELLRRLQLFGARLEVCGVAGNFGCAPRRQHDRIAEQIRQDLRERQGRLHLRDCRWRYEQTDRRGERQSVPATSQATGPSTLIKDHLAGGASRL